MKDLYSFHASEKDFRNYYQKVKKAYLRIFERCGLKAIITEASGAGFTKEFTHEFQVLAKDGEDTIIYCPKFHFSQNKEISKYKEEDECPICKTRLRQGKSIEVGNIFPLGTKYSEALGVFFQDRNGRKKPIIMGSYGIGVPRLMGTIVEIYHDKKGIVWPQSVAPFDVHLLFLKSGKKAIDEKIKKTCEKLYQDLRNSGIEVLYDDSEDKSPGEKFADADLIGIPWRLVVSDRTLKRRSIEIKERSKEKIELIKINSLNSYIRKKFVIRSHYV